MQIDLNNLGGAIVKNDETYLIEDNRFLNNLVLSQTILHPGKETRGHSHPGRHGVHAHVQGGLHAGGARRGDRKDEMGLRAHGRHDPGRNPHED